MNLKKHYFLIFLNDIGKFKFFKKLNEFEQKTFVAVESGFRFLERENLPFDKVYGDFDSILKKELENLKVNKKIEVIEKKSQDLIDSEFVLEQIVKDNGIDKSKKNFWFFLNKDLRLDMCLGHLSLLLKYKKYNIVFEDQTNIYFLLSKNFIFDKKYFKNIKYISFFAAFGDPEIKLTGFKYETKNFIKLKRNDSLFLSNEFLEQKNIVEIKNGFFYVIFVKKVKF